METLPTGEGEVVPPLLVAGRVGRPHGLDGSFRVTGPTPRLLTLGAEVSVAGRKAAIVRRAGTDEQPIVRLESLHDRSAALELRGEELLAPSAVARQLGDDEYWAHELTGCAVRDRDRAVGVVRALIELPSCEALEVELDGGGDLLIPMVRDAIRAVDVRGRAIDVDMAFLGEAS